MLICVFICIFLHNFVVGEDDFQRSFYENHFTLNDQARKAVKSSSRKWPNGLVPYKFSGEYTEGDRAHILNAMEVCRKETCIKFIAKRSDDSEFIEFKKSNGGCGTQVGYRSNNTEGVDVLLTDGCIQKRGAVQLLHVIGLWHEQSRPDRDDFVEIYWDNMQSNHAHNFRKVSSNDAETFDFPYDYDSLMHYPRNAFAKNGKNYTIVAKDNPERKLGQIDKPTHYDLEKVRRMYNCH